MAAAPLFNLAPELKNSLPQSFQLLDLAYHAGINFFDSAKMYPVPQRAETQGRSEDHLGRWIKERNIPRGRLVLATKVSGPSGQMTWIRDGPKCLDAKNITEAIDNSLRRMGTDYMDLYQIHWPDRFVWTKLLSIRYIGLSNETPYGMMKFLQAVEKATCHHRILSVQNSYSLLCLTFDSGMAECCYHVRINLLAYSPLAMGILSGKYFSPDKAPKDARLNLFQGRYSEGESRYSISNTIIEAATREYLEVARKCGLHPVSLATAFVLRHLSSPAPFLELPSPGNSRK